MHYSVLNILFVFILGLFPAAGAFRHPLSSATRENFRFTRATRSLRMASDDTKEILAKVKTNIPKGSVVVVKYGGHAMEDFQLATYFCEDIAELCRLDILPVIGATKRPTFSLLL